MNPVYGQTKQITVGTASAAVVLTDNSTDQVLLTNVGTNLIFVRIGTSADAAILNEDMPILPNAAIGIDRIQGVPSNGAKVQIYVSAIAAAGNTLHITPMGI